MKTRSAIPLVIGAAILLLACLIHFLARHVPSRSHTGLPALLDQIEWLTYDARVKLGAHLVAQDEIAPNMATLFFTDDDVESVNNGTYSETFEPATNSFQAVHLRFKWPWPCFIHGQVVRELSAQGAVATGFDVLFPEEDEFNPLTSIPISEEEVITSDQFFALQLSQAENVVLATEGKLLPLELFRTNSLALGNIASFKDYGVVRRVKPFSFVPIWHPLIKGLEVPLALKLKDADLSPPGKITIPRKRTIIEPNPEPVVLLLNPNGTLRLDPDGNLIIGEDPEQDLGPTDQEPYSLTRVWNLGIVLAARALGLDLNSATFHQNSILIPGPNGISRSLPVDEEGFMLIDWSLRYADIALGKTPVHFGSLESLLLNDLLRKSGETDLTEPFKNRIVVIGSTATGNNMADIGATPLEDHTFLATKHLNIANSILTGRFIHRVPLWGELLIIAFLSALASYLTWRSKVLTASVGIALLAVTYIAVATFLYVEHRIWLAILNPVGGGLLFPYFAVVTYRVMFEQREQRRVRGIFSRIVSPDVVQELLSAENLSLGGLRQEITVFFADVRGFTEFTDGAQATAEEFVRKKNLDQKEAEEVFNRQAADTLKTVNDYLGIIADMVKKHRGTLDKYIGDCVMAFWGAPVHNPQHALFCVRAAVEAQRAMYAFNLERVAENDRRKKENEMRLAEGKDPLPLLPVLTMGTGINTGQAIVGLMGSNATILNYTVFGREVNLASRLEGVSARGRIIISEATYNHILRDDPQMAAKIVELPPTTVKGFRHAVRIFEVPWKDATLLVEDEPPTTQKSPEPPAVPLPKTEPASPVSTSSSPFPS